MSVRSERELEEEEWLNDLRSLGRGMRAPWPLHGPPAWHTEQEHKHTTKQLNGTPRTSLQHNNNTIGWQVPNNAHLLWGKTASLVHTFMWYDTNWRNELRRHFETRAAPPTLIVGLCPTADTYISHYNLRFLFYFISPLTAPLSGHASVKDRPFNSTLDYYLSVLPSIHCHANNSRNKFLEFTSGGRYNKLRINPLKLSN